MEHLANTYDTNVHLQGITTCSEIIYLLETVNGISRGLLSMGNNAINYSAL